MAAPLINKMFVCKLCGKLAPIYRLRAVSNKNYISRYLNSATSKKNIKWQPVIGLEIHAQIQADSKLFSGSAASFGAAVNSQVAFLDTALPGTLPVLNKRCVEAGVITATALDCSVNSVSRFDRKHYFYADLPAGYQITQQRQALANGGHFTYIVYGQTQKDCLERTARITQLQLEQDSGKSLHDEEDQKSLIDLNRAGCALMEIVSEPDFTSGEEARAFVRDLRLLLMTLGTCDGKMSEGSLRVDANISVHQPGEPLGVRSEVKNLNSTNSVKKAIDFEIQRQIDILEGGGEVVNETRSFDIDTGETLPMRDKEAKQDYRFMPEPNLPPLHIYLDDTSVPDRGTPVVVLDQLTRQVPRLPKQMREYVMEKYGLNLYLAAVIVNEGLLSHFEMLVEGRDIKKLTTFIIHEFLGPVRERDLEVSDCHVPTSSIGRLYDWYTSEDLSLINTQKIMQMFIKDPRSDVKDIADRLDLWQINDETYLTSICQQIVDSEPSSVAKYKRGKKRAINKLMGMSRKLTNDRGNPVKISRIFKELMSK